MWARGHFKSEKHVSVQVQSILLSGGGIVSQKDLCLSLIQPRVSRRTEPVPRWLMRHLIEPRAGQGDRGDRRTLESSPLAAASADLQFLMSVKCKPPPIHLHPFRPSLVESGCVSDWLQLWRVNPTVRERPENVLHRFIYLLMMELTLRWWTGRHYKTNPTSR